MEKVIALQPNAGTHLLTGSDSTGDKIVFTAPFKCTFREVRCAVKGTEATALVLGIDYRPTFNSDTDRAEITTFTFAASNLAGNIYSKSIVEDISTRYDLDAGDEIVIEVKTASTANKSMVIDVIVDRVS